MPAPQQQRRRDNSCPALARSHGRWSISADIRVRGGLRIQLPLRMTKAGSRHSPGVLTKRRRSVRAVGAGWDGASAGAWISAARKRRLFWIEFRRKPGLARSAQARSLSSRTPMKGWQAAVARVLHASRRRQFSADRRSSDASTRAAANRKPAESGRVGQTPGG